MLLVETIPSESEAAFRSVVDGMLTDVFGIAETPWWTRYQVGRMFQFGSKLFREFVTPAGSVTLHLIRAAEQTALPRTFIIIGENAEGHAVGKIVAGAESKPLDPAAIELIS